MNVRVSNYQNEETVRTRLVILKGFIEVGPCQTVTQLSVHAIHQNQESKISCTIIITRNCFVTVVELFVGENIIQFTNPENEDDVYLKFHLNLEVSENRKFLLKPLLVSSIDDQECQLNVDEKLRSSYCDRINLGLHLIQSFYSDKLYEMKFPRRSFVLGNKCNIFTTSLSKAKLLGMTSVEVWESLAREIMNNETIWDEDFKYIVFLCQPWKDLEDVKASKHLALGGGGLVLLYYDFLSIWPETVSRILSLLSDDRTNVGLGISKTLSSFSG